MTGRFSRYTRAAAVTLTMTAAVAGVGQTPAYAATAVRASAFGYWSSVSLFGGPPVRLGFGQLPGAPANAASSSVSLPATGGSVSQTDANGSQAMYGPALIFGWFDPATETYQNTGPQSVTAAGSIGGQGTALARASVTMAGPGPLVMDKIVTTCARSGSTRSSSVQVTNGRVETSTDPETGEVVTVQSIPTTPRSGLTVHGILNHVGDSFRVVFNEQTVNPDGSTTVIGAHMYLEGPIAVGELVIAGATCGVTP